MITRGLLNDITEMKNYLCINHHKAFPMGYSDDDIDTILDGDSDAYWNID